MDSETARGRSAPTWGRLVHEESDDWSIVRSGSLEGRTCRVTQPAGRIRKGEAMTLLSNWIQHPIALAIGKTLLHSLWEAGVGGGVFLLVFGGIRSPQRRYRAACTA